MQLSFSLLAVATAFVALVSAHPAQQLKRVTTTPVTTPTITSAIADAGIPTHASTITDALPAAIKTTTPSSCTFSIFLLRHHSLRSRTHPIPMVDLSNRELCLVFLQNILITNHPTVPL